MAGINIRGRYLCRAEQSAYQKVGSDSWTPWRLCRNASFRNKSSGPFVMPSVFQSHIERSQNPASVWQGFLNEFALRNMKAWIWYSPDNRLLRCQIQLQPECYLFWNHILGQATEWLWFPWTIHALRIPFRFRDCRTIDLHPLWS